MKVSPVSTQSPDQSEREGPLRMSRGTDVCSGCLAALGVISVISGIITFAVYDGLYDVIMKSVIGTPDV